MSRSAFHRALLVAPLLLIGCGGVSQVWQKSGASEAEVKADNAVCRAEAEEAYGQSANITRDIAASRRGGLAEVDRLSEQLRSSNTVRNYDAIFDSCMAARGYSRRGSSR